MASGEVLDFEKLLAPIAGDAPAGADLRQDRSPLSIYQVIKTARNQARAAERLAAQEDDPASAPKPDWKPVLQQTPKAIAQMSKDLELSAWLTEALVRMHGFPGLRDGIRLARQLAEQFWDGLHPLPNEDGMVSRVAALAGLNGLEGEGTLIGPIFNIPLTNGSSVRPLTRSDYKQAADLESITDPDRRAARISRGAVSMAIFEKSAAETPPEFFRGLWDELRQCSEEFDKLCAVLDEKCGTGSDGAPAAPPSSAIRSAIDECRQIVRSVAKGVLGDAAGTEIELHDGAFPGAGGGSGGASRADGHSLAGRRIQDRNEAFQALLRVAQFFKETEPHSPVSYALEQAVRWGRMPLPELLGELIPDQSSRESVFKLIGIPPPAPPGS